jgi:transposase
VSPALVSIGKEAVMRYVGLDVGRDFAHAAVVDEKGVARRLGRFRMGEEFAAFAATLGPGDAVALEASGNTWALTELLRRHAGRVVVSNPLRTRAIADAKRKTDDIDAATLAELLAADYLPEVWVPDETTRRLRRLVAHRAGLVRERTATRNRVTAILTRRLVRPPMSDPFGVRGRAWLAGLELPADERLALDAALRLDALLGEEIGLADRAIAAMVVDDDRIRHLLTIPGIGLVTAAGLLAVVGDIGRFARPAKLVSYLGLDPRVRQSGDRPAHGGHITRAGQAHARGLLTEAAHAAVRSPGPLASTYLRLRARRGGGIAIVAVARKLAVLVWHLLTKGEGYRDARPDLVRSKQRALDRLAGLEGSRTRSPQRGATGSSHDRGRTRLRGEDHPHHLALRQAIDRVHLEATPAPRA